MNILIDIGHPAHVHLFRNLYANLTKKGHKVFVTVKDIQSAKYLLHNYNIDYLDLGKKKDSIFLKGLKQIHYNWKIYRLVKKNDIQFGFSSSITIPHVSKITKMKSIVMDDDDDLVEPLFVRFGHPFSDYVFSPAVIKRGKKDTIYYPGYHELAYLHPKRFKPDPGVLLEAGLSPGETFFIMRFNVFKAHHDVGIKGLSLEQKLRLIETLKPYGKIFITTERDIEPVLKEYQLRISPEQIHSLLAYAAFFLGDSQTMTSEAAVLGIPSLRCNSFAGRISYLEEQEKRYGLTYGFQPHQFDELVQKLNDLLKTPNIKDLWQQKRALMLADKIDVTAFWCWFIENYPKSVNIMRNDPNYAYNFR